METNIARLRTHQKNIDRYQGLLKTKLNDTERQAAFRRDDSDAATRELERQLVSPYRADAVC